MAVIVEGISVIVRRDSVDSAYPGGWKAFVADCPNGTLCADPDLARIGFMTPTDVEAFVDRLEGAGLVFKREAGAVDLAVVDQQRGPTTSCNWLEWGHVEINGHRVAACRLIGSAERKLATPEGWCFEESLSASYGFIPSGAEDKGLVFLRREPGLDVFLSRLTGKEVYIGRTSEARIGGSAVKKSE
jgi:hypothetical protein